MLAMIVRPLLELLTAATIISTTLPMGPGLWKALTRMDDCHRLAVAVAVGLLADIIVQLSKWAGEMTRPGRASLVPAASVGVLENDERRREEREMVVVVEWARGFSFAKRDSRR
jgi:hypothetical protein